MRASHFKLRASRVPDVVQGRDLLPETTDPSADLYLAEQLCTQLHTSPSFPVLVQLNNLVAFNQSANLLSLFQSSDLFAILISLLQSEDPLLVIATLNSLVTLTSKSAAFVHSFLEAGLLPLITPLLDIDGCLALSILINVVIFGELSLVMQHLNPNLLIELIQRHDPTLNQKCAKFISIVVKHAHSDFTELHAFLSALLLLLDPNDFQIVFHVVQSFCVVLESSSFDPHLLEQFAIIEPFCQFLTCEFPDVVCQTCRFFGGVFQRKLFQDLHVSIEDLFGLTAVDDQNVQKMVFWCIHCGVLEDRFDRDALREQIIGFCRNQWLNFPFGVAIEAARVVLAVLRPLNYGKLMEFVQNGVLAVLAQFLELDDPKIQRVICQLIGRLLRWAAERGEAQPVLEEFAHCHGMEILEELRSSDDESVSMSADNLAEQIEGIGVSFLG
jgi:hypothetical protein